MALPRPMSWYSSSRTASVSAMVSTCSTSSLLISSGIDDLEPQSYLRLAPTHAHPGQPAAVLHGRGIRATQVQLFGQVDRQLFGALGLDQHAVLLERQQVPAVQLLVRELRAEVPAAHAPVHGLARRQRAE